MAGVSSIEFPDFFLNEDEKFCLFSEKGDHMMLSEIHDAFKEITEKCLTRPTKYMPPLSTNGVRDFRKCQYPIACCLTKVYN